MRKPSAARSWAAWCRASAVRCTSAWPTTSRDSRWSPRSPTTRCRGPRRCRPSRSSVSRRHPRTTPWASRAPGRAAAWRSTRRSLPRSKTRSRNGDAGYRRCRCPPPRSGRCSTATMDREESPMAGAVQSTPTARQRWPEGVDVKVWHRYFGSEFGVEEVQALAEVLQQEFLTNGPQTQAFQEEFAAFCHIPYVFATSSCTTALALAAQLCSLGEGDEVVTTPLTFVSTHQAFMACGAIPVFADVDPRTFNIDPVGAAARVTPRTRAIFVTHLNGQCCDMDAINAIARPHDLLVVEDAAHVVGATYKGRSSGSLGDAAAFSFHSSKNMTTLGEGGMLTTRHSEWAAKVPLLRSMGVNYELDEPRPEPRDYWLPLPYKLYDP